VKRREGDQPSGSSGPPSGARGRGEQGRGRLGRVVLGATLVLAGDAAHKELTDAGEGAPKPPRQVPKAKRNAPLPSPGFAAATPPREALGEKLVPAQRARKRNAAQAAPARLDEPPVQRSDALAEVLPPAPAPAAPMPSTASLAAGADSSKIDTLDSAISEKLVNELATRELASSSANLVLSDSLAAPKSTSDQTAMAVAAPQTPSPAAALPSPLVPEPQLVQAVTNAEVAPLAHEPAPEPEPAKPAQATATRIADTRPPAPQPALEPPELPAPKQPVAAQLALERSPPAPPAPALAPPGASLAEALPTPAFGGVPQKPAPAADTPAKLLPAPAATRLAYNTPPANQLAPQLAPQATLRPSPRSACRKPRQRHWQAQQQPQLQQPGSPTHRFAPTRASPPGLAHKAPSR